MARDQRAIPGQPIFIGHPLALPMYDPEVAGLVLIAGVIWMSVHLIAYGLTLQSQRGEGRQIVDVRAPASRDVVNNIIPAATVRMSFRSPKGFEAPCTQAKNKKRCMPVREYGI